MFPSFIVSPLPVLPFTQNFRVRLRPHLVVRGHLLWFQRGFVQAGKLSGQSRWAGEGVAVCRGSGREKGSIYRVSSLLKLVPSLNVISYFLSWLGEAIWKSVR